MKYNTNKHKKIILPVAIMVLFCVLAVFTQVNITRVSAQIIPVRVSINHLDFGTVFPGEKLEGDFTVTYVEDGNGIDYNIVQKRKPLPEDHPEYPNGGDPEMPGFYRNLCPYLTKISEENEGDIEAAAFVGPNDLSDEWIIYFSVPAVLGKVAQAHDGGVVSISGEYGCDITIEIGEYCGNGVIESGEECDDGNLNDNDECKNDCTSPDACQADIDLMMVMDRSGSMVMGSCRWWKASYNRYITDYNKTEQWCGIRQNSDHPITFTITDNKLAAAKNAANTFLAKLSTTTDQSGLVSYSTEAELNKNLSDGHGVTGTFIDSMFAAGATNIGDAIMLASKELLSTRANPAAAKIQILLTDGMANKPNGPGNGEFPADVAYAEAMAVQAAATGIKVYTIGLGSNVNETMLFNIANITGAEYHFAPTGNDLQAIFDTITEEMCGGTGAEPFCGDNIKNGEEECDGSDGIGEHQECTDECALIDLTYCGDGIKQEPNSEGIDGPAHNGYEECDGDDGTGEYYTCSVDCGLIYIPYCGDGTTDPGEECDDGNTDNGDNCLNDCTLSSSSCASYIDLVIVMDISGSMVTGSCRWWKASYNRYITDYNKTEQWCNFMGSSEHPVTFIITDDKLKDAKDATIALLNKLSPTSAQSGLVSYNTNASLDGYLSNNHNDTGNYLNSLVAAGSTNIGDAIMLANAELLSARANPAAIKIEILLTDGMANKPNGPGYGEFTDDVLYAEAMAVNAATAGIKIYTIGLGSDINEAMLMNIAGTTGGEYNFAPTGADLQAIFDSIAGNTCL